MSDTQLDNFKIANDILKKQGYKLYYFLDNTPEFEEVAQYVEEYETQCYSLTATIMAMSKIYLLQTHEIIK